MKKRLVKRLIVAVITLAVLLLMAFNALIVWVLTGPRSLDALTPYIEDSFKTPEGNFTVHIGQTWLTWDGWRHPIDIRLRNVSVLTKDGQLFSSFPEISMGIDIWMLPLGEVLPSSLTVNHPVLSLFQNDDHSLSFGFRKQRDEPAAEPAPSAAPAADAAADVTTTAPVAGLLAPLLKPDSSSGLRKLRFITIRDAQISVGNRHGVFFEATDVGIKAHRDRQGDVELTTDTHIRYDDYQSTVSTQFEFKKDAPTIDGLIHFEGLLPGVLATLFSDEPLFKMANLPLTGDVGMELDTNGMPQKIAFKIEAGGGEVKIDKYGLNVPVTAASAQGQASNGLHDIALTELMVNFDGASLSGAGTASLKDNDAAIRADLSLKNMAVDKVKSYWPESISPESRKWIVENITGGMITEDKTHVDIKFGDLAQPILPKEDINATITVEGAKVRYLPEHPQATGLKAVVHIDGVSLNSDILAGDYMKGTHLTGGKLEIADLNADNPHIVTTVEADTTAKDAVAFMKLPRVNHAPKLNLQEDAIEGTAHVMAKVGFDFFAPKDANGKPTGEANIDYDVNADMKDISQPGILNRFDVKNGNGQLTINNEAVIFKGAADVNGAHASDATVKYLFRPEKGFDTFIDVTATAPAESLPKFGYPVFYFLKGTIGVKATDKMGTDAEQATATLDLTNAAIADREIDWTKPDKEPATLDLTVDKKDGAVTISSLHLKGKNTDVVGAAGLSPDLSAISRVTLSKAEIGQTNLEKLNYERTPTSFTLEAQGASADVGGFMDHQEGGPRTFSFKHFPATQFRADIGRVIFGKDREITALKGEMLCDEQRCTSATINGQAGAKPVTFRILRNPKGERQVSLHAENAGAFLKDVGTFDGMEGGDLTLTGTFDDSGKNSLLKGKFTISEHTIKNAPVLAKILSLASLTGFIDTLQGNGIRFTRLSAPFTLHDDVITFTGAKTHGDAIGMTMDGTIAMPQIALNMQGTVVPSYSLNTMLGKVPVVGSALTGGEGQGVFAARYSVSGTQDKPDVSVNPLAILTPGFLRGVFDLMDSSPAPAENDD